MFRLSLLAYGKLNQPLAHTTQHPALTTLLCWIFSVMAYHISPEDKNVWSVNRILVSVTKWTTENQKGDFLCKSAVPSHERMCVRVCLHVAAVSYRKIWHFPHLSCRTLTGRTINISELKFKGQADAAKRRKSPVCRSSFLTTPKRKRRKASFQNICLSSIKSILCLFRIDPRRHLRMLTASPKQMTFHIWAQHGAMWQGAESIPLHGAYSVSKDA